MMQKIFSLRNLRRTHRATALIALAAILMMTAISLPARAATMTQIKLTLSTIAATATTSGTLEFTIPTGVDASTDSITITFDAAYDLGTFAVGNYDFEVGDSGTCSSASFSDKTLAASANTGTWGLSQATDVLTLTAPTNATTGEITAGRCVRLVHGTAANAGGTGTATWVNPAAQNIDVDITSELGATDDSGSGSVAIIADDSVNVTATVDPYLTFSISDTTIGFGALSASAATWANAAATGSATDVSAHNLQVSTNADSGYAITYNGATLTFGGETISVATISNDADGTQGSEQFAMNFDKTTGDATIASGYDNDQGPDWNFVANTTTTVVSETGPTATETIEARYLSNIATTTEPGTYTTDITYVASAAF